MKRTFAKQSNPTAGSEIGNGYINPFIVSAEQKISVKYKCRLYGAYDSSEDFIYTLEVLESAEADDIVELHISGPGGSIDAVITLLHAMDKCRCPIHAIGTGTLASAATFPLLAASSYELHPHTTIMFHAASFGAPSQKVNDTVDYTLHAKKQVVAFFKDQYEHFFTKKELKKLLAGKDYWMNAEEFHQRYAARNEKYEEEMKAEEEGVQCVVPTPPPITTEMVKEAAKVGDQQFQEYCDTHQKIIDRNVVTLEKINYDDETVNNAVPLPDEDGWYEWGKPEFPSFIEADTRVDVDYEDGEYYREEKAGELTWGTVTPSGMGDIVERFRICK